MTRGKLISDIELRLTKGKPSDDLELERAQIGHWLDVVRDELVKADLDSELSEGKPLDTFYITRETCISPTVEDLACVDDSIDEYAYTLTSTPMHLHNDQGVIMVRTDEDDLVMPTSLIDIQMIKDMQFTKPSNTNFVYYREGDKLVFFGLNRNPINDPKFIVYYIPQYTAASPSEADEFKIRDHLVGVLLDSVEQIARRQMSTFEDLENDAQQDLDNE